MNRVANRTFVKLLLLVNRSPTHSLLFQLKTVSTRVTAIKVISLIRFPRVAGGGTSAWINRMRRVRADRNSVGSVGRKCPQELHSVLHAEESSHSYSAASAEPEYLSRPRSAQNVAESSQRRHQSQLFANLRPLLLRHHQSSHARPFKFLPLP